MVQTLLLCWHIKYRGNTKREIPRQKAVNYRSTRKWTQLQKLMIWHGYISVTPLLVTRYLNFIYGNESLYSNLWTEKNENNTHLSSFLLFPEIVSIAYVQIFTNRNYIFSQVCKTQGYGSSWYSDLSKSPFWRVLPTTLFSSPCKSLQVNDQNNRRRKQCLIQYRWD